MTKKTCFAGVIIDQVHPSLDKVFHYEVPEDIRKEIQVGMRVLVPFGVHNKGIEGYVFNFDNNIDIPIQKIKKVIKILDPYPLVQPKFIPLIKWMKEEYHCLTIEALRCFIPPGLRMNIRGKFQKVVYLNLKRDIQKHIESVKKRSYYMAEILRVLDQFDGIPLAELSEMTGAPLSSFKNLEKKGWIRLEEEEVYRNPWNLPHEVFDVPPRLSDEQDKAVAAICRGLERGHGRFLLHGVTGSGKTEVYIRSIQKALDMNRQAIVLVPEISLTPQTVERFKKRFGDQVAILHSGLSLGERFDEWRKIREQKVNIVVGARSAIFAPMDRLGIIVIDEAHEDSYKSEARPRYHAVEVARERCILEKAVLVLGSATPTLEDYFGSQRKDYHRIEISHRVDHRPLPRVEIVDMRKEIERGNRSIFSLSLYQALLDVLKRKEQAILLLNRRGYAQFVSCRSCGFVVKCGHCDISLTYHANEKVLKCHYCGKVYPYPSLCPECKSKYIKHFGIGTQRVEEDLKKHFSNARVVRMDMDTTSSKGAHQRILKAFGDGEYDFLLGTQMVAKGLDFPRVTLVGVITADTSLNMPDFRSSEKAFQLITQVAGRAGRGMNEGRVIIQSYQPEHYAIQYASQHDYNGFYNREIQIRQQFGYPPFSHIIRVLVTGEEERLVLELAGSIKGWLDGKIQKNEILKKGLIELGVYPAPLEKIKNKYRWHVLIRINTDMMFIRHYHRLMDECLQTFNQAACTTVVDFNPISLL